MKKYTRTLTTAAVLTALLGTAGATIAMGHEDGMRGCKHDSHKTQKSRHHGGRGLSVQRLADKLDLTEDLRVQIESAVAGTLEQIQAKRESMRENRDELRKIMQTYPVDEAEVQRLATVQGDLKAAMIMLRAQKKATIDAFLSEKQRSQLREMRGKRKSHF